jgi:hypothetical protein
MTFKNIKLKLRATLIFNPLQVRGGGGGGGGGVYCSQGEDTFLLQIAV